jgi:hypothetical protein
MAKGLIIRSWELGSTEGSEYEVFLPEEVLPPLTTTHHHSPIVTTNQNTGSGNTQRSGSGGDSQTTDFQRTSDDDKTDLRLDQKSIDDEVAPLSELLRQAERELTGKNSSDSGKWRELAELLITELKIAAARTTVSNVPAFLTEHLRRRLWKRSAEEMQKQDREPKDVPLSLPADASKCPDCGGTGWHYPDGQDKGVARCRHNKLHTAAVK